MLTGSEMTRQIPDKESLTVEFKSDRAGYSDKELVESVVCMANAEGGVIYLCVENDGTVTGLCSKHRDMSGLEEMHIMCAGQIEAVSDGWRGDSVDQLTNVVSLETNIVS